MVVLADGRSSTPSRHTFLSEEDAQRMRSTGDCGESRKSCDQLATSHHWITSSARCSSDGGNR